MIFILFMTLEVFGNMFIHGSTPPEACQQGDGGVWGGVLGVFVFLSKEFSHRFTSTFRKKKKKSLWKRSWLMRVSDFNFWREKGFGDLSCSTTSDRRGQPTFTKKMESPRVKNLEESLDINTHLCFWSIKGTVVSQAHHFPLNVNT